MSGKAKKLIGLGLFSLFLLYGCSRIPKKMKEALSTPVMDYYSNMVYPVKTEMLTDLIKDISFGGLYWCHKGTGLSETNCSGNIKMSENDEDNVMIVPKINRLENKLNFEMFVYLSDKFVNKYKKYEIFYGNAHSGPGGTSIKSRKIKRNSFKKINNDIYAYHFSWDEKLGEDDRILFLIRPENAPKDIYLRFASSTKDLHELLDPDFEKKLKEQWKKAREDYLRENKDISQNYYQEKNHLQGTDSHEQKPKYLEEALKEIPISEWEFLDAGTTTEDELKDTLAEMRSSLNLFYSNNGRYPKRLAEIGIIYKGDWLYNGVESSKNFGQIISKSHPEW